tara:strand:- start:931 stop:2277 length:1347 start_codon:yes stop_codon:yes gene_type:complete
MAELELNQDELLEAGQPDAKADKGDKNPPKQGSSDDAKIDGGKAEVVKPEENPVDKAVDSVDKAEDGVKEISSDPQQKGEGKPEKADKIKEGEGADEEAEVSEAEDKAPSKMETIKAIVNNMKEMNKEDLQGIFSSISEDEVDESLTKAEIARNIVELVKKLDDEQVQELYKSMTKEEEVEEEVNEEVDAETSEELESKLVEIEIEDDLNAISEALELSEENQEKARTIFKAAVQSKVSEVEKGLKEAYDNELQTSVDKVKADLSEAVDKYLSYVAEEWTKENELAIERGLKAEMTENFIEGLKTLFVEHYVDVPEDKYDVIDELSNRLDEMEVKLDSEVQKNMDIAEELDTLKREKVISESTADLTDSQKEKLESLANGVDFENEEDFAEKISEIKEAYFPADGDEISEDTKVEEGTGTLEDEQSSPVLDPEMTRYSDAISKLKPLG